MKIIRLSIITSSIIEIIEMIKKMFLILADFYFEFHIEIRNYWTGALDWIFCN